jgi:phosphatidylglycerol lysyltransferase
MVTESAAARRLRLVRQHAYNGLALLTLYDGWRYFEYPGVDGFIAYELHRRVAVACGDPVCAEPDLRALLTRFAEYCGTHGWRFAFVGATARVAKVRAELALKPVKVGEEPLFDLSRPSLRGRAAKKARSAINLARRSGIVVEEYRQPSPATDAEIEEVATEWLQTRKGLPMAFLLRSRPLALRDQKRIFIASQGDRVVGVITCSPAPARMMLLVEELLRRRDAPYGTGELLIDVAREAAHRDGYALFSLGVSPLQGATRQPYGRFWLVRALIAISYSRANFIYSFRSLNHFKKKFGPTFWEDSFLVYQTGLLATVLALVAAFSPDGIPSLLLPRRLQWLRFVPAAVLSGAAVASVFLAGFAAWEFPALQRPFLLAPQTLLLARLPADLMMKAARVTLLAHRVVSLIVVLALASSTLWYRRAKA